MCKSSGGCSCVSICNIEQKYREQSNGQGVDGCSRRGLNFRLPVFYSSSKGKNCLLLSTCVGPLQHLQSRDKDKEHLFATADLLHHLFYLWEVQIDFPPLVTLKSQLCPFCHTLKEFRGMRINGLGSRSCRGGKQPEKTWCAVLSILCKQSIPASEEALAEWVNHM